VTRPPSATDALRLEIFRHTLIGITDEMSVTLRKAAYSTNIKTRLDFSCSLFDGRARTIAQSFAQPVHLGTLATFVPAILRVYDAPLEAGDAILCNQGHLGGLHLNDVCLLAPLIIDGKPFGYAVSMAHHVDIGGGTPGSIGLHREQYQEGLIIPPVRVMHDGVMDRGILAMLVANVRSPREAEGDLRAQLGSVSVGLRRFSELIEERGLAAVERGIEDLLDYTHRRSVAAIAHLPRGTIEATDYLDDDGMSDEPVKIHARITIADEKVTFDLTGTDAQRPSSINTTRGGALSACAYALRCMIDPDLPINDGFYRVIDMITTPGSVIDSVRPAAISGGADAVARLTETALRAFATILPELSAADSKGTMLNISFGGVDPRTGAYYVYYETQAGGYGGRLGLDGMDAIQPHAQNTENAPIEETEANYPVRFVRYELIPDSEGPGRWRGGLGLRRDYVFEGDVTFSVMAERVRFAPQGLLGGGPARSIHYILDPEGKAIRFPSKFTIDIPAGGVMSIQTAGGGGFGEVGLRDPGLVHADVEAGRISPARARDVYGVTADEAAAGSPSQPGAGGAAR
jgi:N-methylhydantoinase B